MNKKRIGVTIGIVVVVAVLVVVFDAVLANHQPVIVSLEAEPTIVLLGQTSHIVCNATDRDGDNLIYGWSASGGTISVQGAKITWTPRTTGSYNITVIVTDGRGGVATDYRTITVRRNQPPIITNLTADADWTLPFRTLNVTCIARDNDGHVLTYEWSASGGDISGTGPVVIWKSPKETGIYDITVTVKDGYGGSDTRTLSISVVTGQPPTIEDLRITADHCYLRTNTSPYKVGRAKDYSIQCIVADVSTRVSYNWSCTGGKIHRVSDDGSMIAWTAPDEAAQVTITVIVSDIRGNQAVKQLVLDVAGCNPCIFPGCAG